MPENYDEIKIPCTVKHTVLVCGSGRSVTQALIEAFRINGNNINVDLAIDDGARLTAPLQAISEKNLSCSNKINLPKLKSGRFFICVFDIILICKLLQ